MPSVGGRSVRSSCGSVRASACASGPPKTAAAQGELRVRTRTALLGLEDRDLAMQAQWGVQGLVTDLRAGWEVDCVLRDIMTGLADCSAPARRLRYRLAAFTVKQKGFAAVAPLVPHLMRRVVEQAAAEHHGAELDELSGLVRELACAALRYQAEADGAVEAGCGLSGGWLGDALLRPLLRCAVKAPARQTTASAFVLAHTALAAFREWAASPAVAAAARDCLALMLRSLQPGSGARVAEAYLPLRQCVEVLGAALAPAAVRSLLLECLNGIKCRADWQVRRQATETLASMVAAIQVHRQTANGEWQLEPTEGVAVVSSHKALVAAALADVKYDKIALVREPLSAAERRALDFGVQVFVPSPPPSPTRCPSPPVGGGDAASRQELHLEEATSAHKAAMPAPRRSTQLPEELRLHQAGPEASPQVPTGIETPAALSDALAAADVSEPLRRELLGLLERNLAEVQAAQGGDSASHALLSSPRHGPAVAHAGRGGVCEGGSPRRGAHIADLLASKELLLACFSMARERTK
ncbi:hypothetical protein WJX81_008503 [Elliptochloris bilobata]|uniref:TOG domain-containing protein n=1 Tax=Elliptochloris bilobata TaxID=381761 RepID=A0AAW1QJK8_9CHLO